MTGEAPAAYEEKSVPSSGRGPSISRSPAICQERGLPYSRSSGAAVLPRRDKVVTLLDKIRNNRHGNPLTSLPYWRPIWSATSWPRNWAMARGVAAEFAIRIVLWRKVFVTEVLGQETSWGM